VFVDKIKEKVKLQVFQVRALLLQSTDIMKLKETPHAARRPKRRFSFPGARSPWSRIKNQTQKGKVSGDNSRKNLAPPRTDRL